MTQFVALEDFVSTARTIAAGTVLDSVAEPLDKLLVAGLITAPYQATMQPFIDAWQRQKRINIVRPSLAALLLSRGFLGAPSSATGRVVWRPGVPSFGSVVATAAEVAAAAVESQGVLVVLVDDTVIGAGTPARWDVTAELFQTVEFRPFQFRGGNNPVIVEIDDGAQMINPGMFRGTISVRAMPSAVPPIRMSAPYALFFREGASFELLPGSAVEFVRVDADFANLVMLQGAYANNPVGMPAVRVTSGFSVVWVRLLMIGNQAPDNFIEGDAALLMLYDASIASSVSTSWTGPILRIRSANAAQMMPAYTDTAGRPTIVEPGQINFNSDSNRLEAWNGSAWVEFQPSTLRAATSVIGRSAGTIGDAADIVAASDDTLLSRIAGTLSFAALTLAMIPDVLITGAKLVLNTVGNAQLRQGAATSVIGRASGASGDVDDIAAGADDTLLGRVAGALSFGALTLAMIPDALITGAKLVVNTVSDTQLRQSVGTSVVGRAAGTTGDVADVVAGADDTLLRRVAGALSFGALTLASIPDGLITAAKMAVSVLHSPITVIAAGPTNITTGTDAVFATITPGAGTYWVAWSGSVQVPNGQDVTASIWSAGVQVVGTERQESGDQGVASATSLGSFATHAEVTVTAGQAIEGRARRSGGTGILNGRTLSVIRIG